MTNPEIQYGFTFEEMTGEKEPVIVVKNSFTPDYGYENTYTPTLNRALVLRLSGRVLIPAGAQALLNELK